MPFEFEATALTDVILVKPRVFGDDRGFFLETYKRSEFVTAGIDAEFVQDNHSLSTRGTLRGIHFQREPAAQGKLVRVVTGAVWDVAVDLRRSSPAFGASIAATLTAANAHMLWIPPGFGHAFVALEDGTHLAYKCTAEYSPEHDAGIRFDDPDLAIEWPEIDGAFQLSDKDRALPRLEDAEVFA